ncbi:MAG TPA: inosine/xanthosine triphosphatase [Candidatus Paceibacterota bacterium]|nr:inosine/xanthosine triphosphatase [Candidatus Paceibacterota bacterium]
MKKIIVASKNPVKLNAALEGFRKIFPSEQFEVEGVAAASGVGDQPMSDAEAYQGAWNRVENVSKGTPADFWVGIEGGVEEKGSEMEVFAWVVVRSKDGRYGKGRTGTFFLPKQIAELVKQGKELAEADDIVFKRSKSGHGNGAIGILTDDVIDRTKYYIEAVIFSLIPFKNEGLY